MENNVKWKCLKNLKMCYSMPTSRDRWTDHSSEWATRMRVRRTQCGWLSAGVRQLMWRHHGVRKPPILQPGDDEGYEKFRKSKLNSGFAKTAQIDFWCSERFGKVQRGSERVQKTVRKTQPLLSWPGLYWPLSVHESFMKLDERLPKRVNPNESAFMADS